MTTPMSPSSRFTALNAAGSLVLMVVAVLLLARPVHAEPGEGDAPKPWVVECIDCPHVIRNLTPQAAQTDSQGTIHVVYGGDALYHAWQTPTGWQSEVADAAATVGQFAALAIDAKDRLHAVYLDSSTHTLRYGVREAGGWRIEIPAPAIVLEADPAPTIAAGPDGQPQIALYRAGEGDLYYLVRTAAGWQQELVDGEGDTGRSPWLAVDSTGKPHISYIDATQGNLRYAVKQPGGWTLATIDSQYGEWALTALALDRGDKATVAATKGSANQGSANQGSANLGSAVIVVYEQEGAGWRTETPAALCSTTEADWNWLGLWNCGQSLSLYRDAGGILRLAYYNIYGPNNPYSGPTYLLRYAERREGQWTVFAGGKYGISAQVAVDGAGAPHVLSVGSAMALSDYRAGPIDWPTTLIDQGGMLDGQSSLAIDASQGSHVSAYDSARGEARYYLRTVGGWAASGQPTFPRARPAATRTVLAIDPAGRPQVMFPDSMRGLTFVRYMTADLGAWTANPTLYTLPTTAAEFDQAIDRTGAIHTVTVDRANVTGSADGVYYGKYDGKYDGSLQSTRIDGDGTAASVSLAIDARGAPHIAYISAAGRTLRYATLRNGQWVTATVAAVVPVATNGSRQAALALGPDGLPQIAYAGREESSPYFSADYIYLAKFDGKSWASTIVVESSLDNAQLSLVVDGQRVAHIAFYDSRATALKYARVAPGEQARVVVLDSEGDVGRAPSIALGTAGLPTISYNDASRSDLKRAYIPFTATTYAYLPVISRPR